MVLNDHRVQSLSCANLTGKLERAKSAVALALRPDIFNSQHHIDIPNWGFRYGVYDLGACWALSRFQRLYFHLREPGQSMRPFEISDQARAHEMYQVESGWQAYPLKELFFMPERSEQIWRDWESGWTEPGWSGVDLHRSFKRDLEYYQVYRFHQFQNIRYIQGPNQRTAGENQTTWTELQSLTKAGRRPLIIVRADRYYQHVVMVKDIVLNAKGASIFVYDSNSPWRDREIIWHRDDEMFSAFDVINGMQVPDPQAYIGIYLVDQDENEALLAKLAIHYREVCKNQRP